MPLVVAEAFVDANSTRVLSLAMLRDRQPEHPVDARLRSRVASFVRPALGTDAGVQTQVFVVRHGGELLGWIGAGGAADLCSLDIVQTALEAAIGGHLKAIVREVRHAEGRYVATRIGAGSSARTCAEVAALVGVQCGWDESAVLDVTVDGERFALRATYDSEQLEWLFSAAEATVVAPSDPRTRDE